MNTILSIFFRTTKKIGLLLILFIGFTGAINVAWLGPWTLEPNYWKPHLSYGDTTEELVVTFTTPVDCKTQFHWQINRDGEWIDQVPLEDTEAKQTHAFRMSNLTEQHDIKYWITVFPEFERDLSSTIIKDLMRERIIPGRVIIPTGYNSSIRFVAYGDNRPTIFGTSTHKALAESMLKQDPQFVLNLGDLVQTGLIEREWAQYFTSGDALLSTIPLLPTPGNHEYYGGSDFNQHSEENATLYLKAFTLPGNESYYSYDIANIHIISLDISSGDGSKNAFIQENQMQWLDHDLQTYDREKIDWVFLMFHYPIEASGQSHENLWTDILGPVFEKNNVSVDVIFVGHIHQYERVFLNTAQTWEIVSAGGGAEIDQWKAKVDFINGSKCLELSHSYVTVEIEGRTFSLSAHLIDGTVFDTLTITK